ncbi:PEP-CTERM sorting domain-containing protein [Pseudoduganella armeniaca]|uniref:PEP-CTERM sorting domain-containing protein n=1 Tax=Pseudoduganella armeniaca TaxID=2072590 RepID=UPI001E4E622F|nr:PEP-CTERM sorting domain-containing protein [Pseudoduganella armeniaca]
MKKVLSGLLLGAACATSAQAALQTFQFTANINSVRDSNTEVLVESGTVEGKVIAPGEKVVGTLTFDLATNGWDHFSTDDSKAFQYDGLSIEAQFVDSGLTTKNESGGYVRVTDGTAGIEHDELRVVAQKYSYDPYYMSSFVLVTTDESGQLLNSTDATTQQFMLLKGAAFNFNVYAQKDTGEFGWTYFSGDITSMTPLSAVPEPGTYAMLLGGLGLIGWRRRKSV